MSPASPQIKPTKIKIPIVEKPLSFNAIMPENIKHREAKVLSVKE